MTCQGKDLLVSHWLSPVPTQNRARDTFGVEWLCVKWFYLIGEIRRDSPILSRRKSVSAETSRGRRRKTFKSQSLRYECVWVCVCVLADVSAFLMDGGYVQWVCGSRLEQWMRERMLSLSLAFSRDKGGIWGKRLQKWKGKGLRRLRKGQEYDNIKSLSLQNSRCSHTHIPCMSVSYKPSAKYLCSTKYHTWIGTDQGEGTGQKKFDTSDIKCTVGAGLKATRTQEFTKIWKKVLDFPSHENFNIKLKF